MGEVQAYEPLTEEGLNKILEDKFNAIPYPRVVCLPPLHYDYVTALKNGDEEGMKRASYLININYRRNLTDIYLTARKQLDRDTYRAFCLLKAKWGMDKHWASSEYRYEWRVFSHWDSESDLNTDTNLVLTKDGFELVTYETWGWYYQELDKQKITLKQVFEL